MPSPDCVRNSTIRIRPLEDSTHATYKQTKMDLRLARSCFSYWRPSHDAFQKEESVPEKDSAHTLGEQRWISSQCTRTAVRGIRALGANVRFIAKTWCGHVLTSRAIHGSYGARGSLQQTMNTGRNATKTPGPPQHCRKCLSILITVSISGR